MTALKGDFISFSFNGVHSSDLGIVRTSDGNRFNDNLLPTIQDKTVQVPGADGTYFFGSYYTQKTFTVPIAFDSLTEDQYQELRRCFGSKGIHELIFDERPYKVYMAKINGNPQLKTICFDTEDTNGNPARIYKGEGTLNFICYYPFARSRFKYLEDYTSDNIPEWENWPGVLPNEINEIISKDELYNPSLLIKQNYGNRDEWISSSGIVSNSDKIYDEAVGNESSWSMRVHNGGDLETDLQIYINFNNLNSSSLITLKDVDDYEHGHLNLANFSAKGEDDGFCIDTKSNLIVGVKDGVETGNLYNEHIEGGDFFKIPVGDYVLTAPYSFTVDYNYIYY